MIFGDRVCRISFCFSCRVSGQVFLRLRCRSPFNPLAKVGGTLGQALWHSMQAPEDWSCLAALVQGRGGFWLLILFIFGHVSATLLFVLNALRARLGFVACLNSSSCDWPSPLSCLCGLPTAFFRMRMCTGSHRVGLAAMSTPPLPKQP